MHKKNLHRNTDSIRIARATQVRLDKISDKTERQKHRSIKSNHHEKIKIWNELKWIHRVFEPLYVIKENQEKLGRKKSSVSKASKEQNLENSASDNRGDKMAAAAFVKQPRLLRRAETQGETLDLRRRHTEPKIQAAHTSRSRDHLHDPCSFGLEHNHGPILQPAGSLSNHLGNTSPNFVLLPRSPTFRTLCRRLQWVI